MLAAVIGADELGATIARKLAERGLVREVIIYDVIEGLPQGKSLDILQSAPILNFDASVRGSNCLEDLSGCQVIVLASFPGAISPRYDVGGAARFFSELGRFSKGAILVVAADESGATLKLATKEGGFKARRVIGSAPLAQAGAIKHLLASHIEGRLKLRLSARELDLMLFGTPPEKLIVPLSLVAYDGIPLERRVPAVELRGAIAKAAALPRLGPYALAAAAARVVEAIVADSGSLFPCYVFIDGEYGLRGAFLAAPARIGRGGVIDVEEFTLDPVDKVAIENLVPPL